MTKKALIEISLVKESETILNAELEKELFDCLCKGQPKIPWQNEVKKVTVT